MPSSFGKFREAVWFSVATTFLIIITGAFCYADELVLDESLTEFQSLGDFNVSHCSTAVDLRQAGLFNDEGQISTGQLYSFYKSQGIESIDTINLCFDLGPGGIRTDHELGKIELRIEDLNAENGERLYSLGNNSLMLPAYEASDLKPEAQLSLKLGYDFMKQFNENSTEKIKIQYTVDGEEGSVPMSVAVLPESSVYSPSRIYMLLAFSAFWIIVFKVLFRITAPRNDQATSPAVN